jgi:hypothetical protein
MVGYESKKIKAYGKAHCVGKTKERGFDTRKGESRKAGQRGSAKV